MSLRLLHVSDVENAYDDPAHIGRLAALLEERATGGTVVLGSGDNTAPGVLSLVTDGEQSLPFAEAVGLAVDTFGNHDFDHGLDGARELVAASPQTWVTANVALDGERFAADHTAPWTVLEREGVRIGVTGVTAEETPEFTPPAAPLTVADAPAAAADAVDALGERADVTVVLAHVEDAEAVARASGADLVLAGHRHTALVERVGDALVTRPTSNGESIVEITGDPGAFEATVRPVPDGPAPTAGVGARVTAALRKRVESAGLADAVATVEEPIERTDAVTLGGESRVGNLIADAYRWLLDADVGLQNGGGIRHGPPLAGEVTVADLIGLVPFEEPVVLAELTGAELEAICREAAGVHADFGEDDWWNAHLSGVELEWDPAAAAPAAVRIDGGPVDPTATYTLATSAYLSYTRIEFPTLTADHVVERGPCQYDAIVTYARECGIDPTIEGRIRGW